MSELVGTPRQVEWAARIRQERVVAGWPMPDIDDARFWIDTREIATLYDWTSATEGYLAERDRTWDSPFTESFPRRTRDDAVQALRGLRRLSGTIGVVVLDLETTGLKKDDRVVEIAVVRWPSREVVIDTVVWTLDLAAAEITGIARWELDQARPFVDRAAGRADDVLDPRCHGAGGG